MAEMQHKDARKLLRIISSALAKGNTLTCRKVAESMGRLPAQNHSRAIAQVCDLLDAAACFAGVPALALVAVREESGKSTKKPGRLNTGTTPTKIQTLFTTSAQVCRNGQRQKFGRMPETREYETRLCGGPKAGVNFAVRLALSGPAAPIIPSRTT